MRPIHVVRMDKARPAVTLTREIARPYLNQVTVAPITSRIRGLACEVPVGARNGLDRDSVINCDLVTTVPGDAIGDRIGYLLPEQERALAVAILAAYALEHHD